MRFVHSSTVIYTVRGQIIRPPSPFQHFFHQLKNVVDTYQNFPQGEEYVIGIK